MFAYICNKKKSLKSAVTLFKNPAVARQNVCWLLKVKISLSFHSMHVAFARFNRLIVEIRIYPPIGHMIASDRFAVK